MAGDSLIGIALAHLATISDLSEEQLRGYLDGWTIVPALHNGRVIGVGVMAGCEIHFVMKPEYRHAALLRGVARTFIAKLFEKHEFLTTRAALADMINQRFVTRFGFKETERDERFVYYVLNGLPFSRKE
jgi:hypothetical protein